MKLADFRKKVFFSVFNISLIFIFSTVTALPKNQTSKLIKDYLGEISTLQANFSQTNHTGVVITGKLFVKKPGKIRFSYDHPHNLQIVSKQSAVLIFDPRNGNTGPLTYPLSSTPLGFLTTNDLGSLINKNSESFETDDSIFLKVRNPQYLLSIEFNKKPFSLAGWEFENQMGEVIEIVLDDIQKNKYISDEIFKTEKDYDRFKK